MSKRKKRSKNSSISVDYFADEVGLYSYENLLGRRLNEMAEVLEISPVYFDFLIKKHNLSAYTNITNGVYIRILKDILPFINEKISRKIKESNSTCGFAKRYNQRFTPRPGIEGNYFKLIYNRPKQ